MTSPSDQAEGTISLSIANVGFNLTGTIDSEGNVDVTFTSDPTKAANLGPLSTVGPAIGKALQGSGFDATTVTNNADSVLGKFAGNVKSGDPHVKITDLGINTISSPNVFVVGVAFDFDNLTIGGANGIKILSIGLKVTITV